MTLHTVYNDPTTRFRVCLPKLEDAIARYRGDENWATEGAVLVACAALAGQEWALDELERNPNWRMTS